MFHSEDYLNEYLLIRKSGLIRTYFNKGCRLEDLTIGLNMNENEFIELCSLFNGFPEELFSFLPDFKRRKGIIFKNKEDIELCITTLNLIEK